MPASIVAAFGLLVIELSKVGLIKMSAFADEQQAAKNDRTASGWKGCLTAMNSASNDGNRK